MVVYDVTVQVRFHKGCGKIDEYRARSLVRKGLHTLEDDPASTTITAVDRREITGWAERLGCVEEALLNGWINREETGHILMRGNSSSVDVPRRHGYIVVDLTDEESIRGAITILEQDSSDLGRMDIFETPYLSYCKILEAMIEGIPYREGGKVLRRVWDEFGEEIISVDLLGEEI